MRKTARVLAAVLAPIILAAGAVAVGAEPPDPASSYVPAGKAPDGAPADKKPPGPRKYDEVVTDKARTSAGLFNVHRVGDKTYYEIPSFLFGREMFWYTEVAKVPSGIGYSGQPLGDRVVRWERRSDKVYLRAVSSLKRAEGEEAVRRAVERASLPPIIMAFDVEAEGTDNAAVVEVTRLLLSDVPEFSALGIFASYRLPGPPGVDLSRSYVDEVKAFPGNIEARAALTYALGPPPPAGHDPAKPPPPRFPEDVRSATVLVHHSMALLPETPMRGRYFDPRVGYYTRSFEDYSGRDNRVVRRQFISRFRLEKRDPAAPVSEPLKPIVFYMSREVPEEWRPYIRKGVEDWNEAFEAAGFRKAVVCRDAPSPEEDPAWDPEDARYSVIRWSAEPIANATGPHVHDPRSGEILSSHIVFWHDILKIMQGWYFVLCSPLDERARKLPFTEPLMGELIRYVAAHETGHALGLRHNHKASSAYPVTRLRDRAFTDERGSTASIMSYGRFNYVAQPGDNVTRLIPRIGPYDRFAVEWGYGPLPEADTPEEEIPRLDGLAARQIEEPWLRFGGEDGPAEFDPTVKAENIGDDSVAATALGLANLERVIDLLVPATTKLGEDYAVLDETYQYLLEARHRWFASVVKLVGGVVETRYLGDRGGEPFARVPKAVQREAVRFLLDRAFVHPGKLVDPKIVNRIRYFGVGEPVMHQQRSLLEELLSAKRFKLLMDAESISRDEAYTARELMSDVQNGIWRELSSPRPAIDIYRRSLQRAYLDHIRVQFEKWGQPLGGTENRPPADFPAPVVSVAARQTDFRAVSRSALKELTRGIKRALGRTADPMTAAHLADCLKEIDLILNPKG